MSLLLKREKQRKERRAFALPLSFVSHALEKDTRFLYLAILARIVVIEGNAVVPPRRNNETHLHVGDLSGATARLY